MSDRYHDMSSRHHGIEPMEQGQRDWPKLMLRLPPDAKVWVEEQAKRHATSQNSEIVRSIRERMDRTTKTGSEGAVTPTKP